MSFIHVQFLFHNNIMMLRVVVTAELRAQNVQRNAKYENS